MLNVLNVFCIIGLGVGIAGERRNAIVESAVDDAPPIGGEREPLPVNRLIDDIPKPRIFRIRTPQRIEKHLCSIQRNYQKISIQILPLKFPGN